MAQEHRASISRRRFIRQTSLLTGALWSGRVFGQTASGPASAPASAPASGSQPASAPASRPSERIRVGFVGMGSRASGYLRTFLEQPDVDVVAIADVYDPHAARGAARAAQAGHRPVTYRDFRRLLDHKDIDAVVIGTPDHWHPLITILACEAGKDVYVEKPLAHTILEGRTMVKAARRYNRVTQMGTQIHASENYRRVVEIVQSGMLGDITKTRLWIARNEAPAGLGRPPDSDPPPDADYDLWLGPAPKRPFNPLRFQFNWRYFWDYAGGTLADMSCHTIDLLYWAMRLDAPRTVTASGGRYALQDIAETPDTMEAVWEFPPSGDRKRPMQMVWSLTEGNLQGINGKTLGVAFYGSQATLIADYESHVLLDAKNQPIAERPPASIPPSPGHIREFLNSVKTRARCSCDIEYGWQLTKVPVIANIACRLGVQLVWDDASEQFVDNAAANAMLSRPYRAPWTLPVL